MPLSNLIFISACSLYNLIAIPAGFIAMIFGSDDPNATKITLFYSFCLGYIAPLVFGI